MRLSPLHLRLYFIKSLRFALKPGFDQEFKAEAVEASSPRLKVNVHAERDEDDPMEWRCDLSIETSDDTAHDFPYTFSVALSGLFHVDEKYPAENAEMLARVNAPSVLYSAARELLASVTGRGLYPPVLLPSASFVPDSHPVTKSPGTETTSEATSKTSKRTKAGASKSLTTRALKRKK